MIYEQRTMESRTTFGCQSDAFSEVHEDGFSDVPHDLLDDEMNSFATCLLYLHPLEAA